jgi:mRNA interferase RelE/StbE
MPYQVLLKPRARRDMDTLPNSVRERVARAIDALASDPRPAGVKKLQGDANLWRIRLGAYRIVYEIYDDKLIVLIVRVADRKDIYR